MPESSPEIILRLRRGVSYDAALGEQLAQVERMKRDASALPLLLLVEHTPVITLGRSGDGSHLTSGAEQLAASGIEMRDSRRGGDVTYHGPGQWTVYPILRLREVCPDLHRYMRMLEEVTIRFLARRSVAGFRVDGKTGVWVASTEPDQPPRKISAVGIAVTGWISYHGTALNVQPDLTPFRTLMTPCGISEAEGGVTSLAEVTDTDCDMDGLAHDWVDCFSEVFGMKVSS